VDLRYNMGMASFRVEHGKVELGLMGGCHQGSIGILDVDGGCVGSFVNDRACRTGVVGCTNRVGG
jgi:hypothetical protein